MKQATDMNNENKLYTADEYEDFKDFLQMQMGFEEYRELWERFQNKQDPIKFCGE